MDNNNKIVNNPSDHLANERTFLAWIRTSIAIMGVWICCGKIYVVYKANIISFEW